MAMHCTEEGETVSTFRAGPQICSLQFGFYRYFGIRIRYSGNFLNFVVQTNRQITGMGFKHMTFVLLHQNFLQLQLLDHPATCSQNRGSLNPQQRVLHRFKPVTVKVLAQFSYVLSNCTARLCKFSVSLMKFCWASEKTNKEINHSTGKDTGQATFPKVSTSSVHSDLIALLISICVTHFNSCRVRLLINMSVVVNHMYALIVNLCITSD